MTLGELIRLLLIAAGAFVVMGLVYSLWKFEQLSRAAEAHSDEPMDRRTAFLLRIAARLGLGRAREGPFCVVLAEAIETPGGPTIAAKRLVSVLKPLVRDGSDEIVELDGARVGLLIGCEPVVIEKLYERWTRSTGFVIRAGSAGHPASASGSEALLEVAEAVLDATSFAAGRALQFQPEAAGRAPAGDEGESAADPRIVDPLTGVLRSERVAAAALKFMSRWRRDGRPVALILLKFDDLEAVGERYGDSAREDSLRGMGRLLSISVREEDLIGRLDEDEFLIMAPLREGDGLPMARRVLDRFMHLGARAGGGVVRGTVSVGVASAPGDAREFLGLLKCARTALNRGQRAGRGRCTKYTPAMAAELRRLDAAPHDRF